jgi:hypothetical protein
MSATVHGEIALGKHVHSDEGFEGEAVFHFESDHVVEYEWQSCLFASEPDAKEESPYLSLAMGGPKGALAEVGEPKPVRDAARDAAYR